MLPSLKHPCSVAKKEGKEGGGGRETKEQEKEATNATVTLHMSKHCEQHSMFLVHTKVYTVQEGNNVGRCIDRKDGDRIHSSI